METAAVPADEGCRLLPNVFVQTCRERLQLKSLVGGVTSDESSATEVKTCLVLSVGLPEATVNPYSPAVDGTGSLQMADD